jgi:NAD(P)-dependent dehydrogenase (short-subunit alcohol dehydrogenase family)
MKQVVITGSTRGIGRGLAESFLKKGWMVTLNGRNEETVTRTVLDLNQNLGTELCSGIAADVTVRTDVQNLWDSAAARGPVDVWINNAGRDQSRSMLWELSEDECRQLLNVNLLGSLNGISVAFKGMESQGRGRIYNMEGFGSNGMTQPGVSLYGTTKAAVSYLAKSLRKEESGSPVMTGTISPGMVLTDLLLQGMPEDSTEAERTKKIFNILADRVEVVTPWIVDQISEKESLNIAWLTKPKIIWRFMTSSFVKRKIL